MTPLQMRDFLERMFATMTDVNAAPEQVAAFFTPDYVQKVDGKQLDRGGFLNHVRALRTALSSSSIAFEHFVSDGTSAATVHVADAVKKTGERIRLKVIAFYKFEDGRIKLIDELTHLLEGGAADRELGSVLPPDS